MVLIDVDYCCFRMDIGAYSECSDYSIFKNSNFCKRLEGNYLNIRGPRQLPNEDNGSIMPFVVVEDEEFAETYREVDGKKTGTSVVTEQLVRE